MTCKSVLTILLVTLYCAVHTEANDVTQIDIYTADCEDCGMTHLLGQLTIKVTCPQQKLNQPSNRNLTA